MDLTSNVSDVDDPLSQLSLNVSSSYVEVKDFILVFTYPTGGVTTDLVTITLSDGNASSHLELTVRVYQSTRYNDIIVNVLGEGSSPLDNISLLLSQPGEVGGTQLLTNASGIAVFPGRPVGRPLR